MSKLIAIGSLIIAALSLIVIVIVCLRSLNEVPSMIRDEQQDLNY